MPRAKATRVTTVQTPGAEAAAGQDTDQETEAQAGQDAGDDDLPPDIQAIVDKRVAAAVKADRRLRGAASKPSSGLPTQAEAMKMVEADPKHRSVLSEDGWVVHPKPAQVQRDENGFAKA